MPHLRDPARSRVRGRGWWGCERRAVSEPWKRAPRRATPRGRGVARVACGESAAAAACVRCAPTPHRHNNGASIPITSRFTGSSVFSGLVLGSAARERGGMASDRRARRERQRDRIVSMDIQRPRARIARARARAEWRDPPASGGKRGGAGTRATRAHRSLRVRALRAAFCGRHGPQRQLCARGWRRWIVWSGEARFESAMTSKGEGTLHGRLTSHHALGAWGESRLRSHTAQVWAGL